MKNQCLYRNREGIRCTNKYFTSCEVCESFFCMTHTTSNLKNDGICYHCELEGIATDNMYDDKSSDSNKKQK